MPSLVKNIIQIVQFTHSEGKSVGLSTQALSILYDVSGNKTPNSYGTNKDIRGINVAIKTGADVLVIGQIPTPVDCSTDSAEDTLCGIYNNRDKYGITSGWFYSTSEVDETFVWSVYFKNGSVGNVVYGKAGRNNVVCVGN